jgi:hypothetical protein
MLILVLVLRLTNALLVPQLNVPRPTRHVFQLQKQMAHALGPKLRRVPAPVPAQKHAPKSKSKPR